MSQLNPQQIKGLKKIKKQLAVYRQHEPIRFIYIVKCHEFYKIGITYNIENRLNSLQCGNPYEIELIYCVRSKKSELLEKELHIALDTRKERREWFLLESDFIEELIVFLSKYESR